LKGNCPGLVQVLKEYRRRLGLSTAIDPNDETPFYPNRHGKHYLLSSLFATVSKKLAEANFQTIRDGKTTAHYFHHYFARSAYNGKLITKGDSIGDGDIKLLLLTGIILGIKLTLLSSSYLV
jgi:integrase